MSHLIKSTSQESIVSNPLSPDAPLDEQSIQETEASLSRTHEDTEAFMDSKGILSRNVLFKPATYPKGLTLCQNGKAFALYDAKHRNICLYYIESKACLYTIPRTFKDGYLMRGLLEWYKSLFLANDFLLITAGALDPLTIPNTTLFLYDLRDHTAKDLLPPSIQAELMERHQEGWRIEGMRCFSPTMPDSEIAENKHLFHYCITLISSHPESGNWKALTIFCRYDTQTHSSEILKRFPLAIEQIILDETGSIEAYVTLTDFKKLPQGTEYILKHYQFYEIRDKKPYLLLEGNFKKTPCLYYDKRNSEFPILTGQIVTMGYSIPLHCHPEKNAFTHLSRGEISSLKADIKSFAVNPKNPKEVIWYINSFDEMTLHVRYPTGFSQAIKMSKIHSHPLFSSKEFLVHLIESLQIKRPFLINWSTSLCYQYFLLSPATDTSPVQFKCIYSREMIDDLEPAIGSKCSMPQSFTFQARDGLSIQGYLTLPRNQEAKNLPALLKIHGGPISRDRLSIDMDTQIWASRGFAVVQINFRGSKGFGSSFQEAGYGEYNRKMTDDLIDGLNYLIQKDLINPDKIVAKGASYGAFAVASCLTRYPDFFICGIAKNGNYNLIDTINEAPQNRKTYARYYGITLSEDNSISEPDLEKLRAMSPSYFLHNLKKPLLFIGSTQDAICKPEQTEDCFKTYMGDREPIKSPKLSESITQVFLQGEGHTLSLGALLLEFTFTEVLVSQLLPEIFKEPLTPELKEKIGDV